MKDLKKKLTASVAMLGVSAVMLSGVSYAWYTLSTNPEVKGIKATAVANENLEIALMKATTEKSKDVDDRSVYDKNSGTQGSKTGENYMWGNVVDVANYIDATKAQLRPATFDTNVLKYATYGDDGRVSGFANLTAGEYTTDKEGVAYEYASYQGNSTTNYAVRVDYWVRSNVNGTLELQNAGKRDVSNETTPLGEGSYIQSDAFKTGGVYAGTKDAVKVVFAVTPEGENATTTYTEAENTLDAATGKVTLSATNLESLTANTAYKVSMYVYLNGKVVTNAMAADDIENIAVNVQFNNTGITSSSDGAMQK